MWSLCEKWQFWPSTDFCTSGITETELLKSLLVSGLSSFSSVSFTTSGLSNCRRKKRKGNHSLCNLASTNFKPVDICSRDFRAIWAPCIFIKAPCWPKGLLTQRSPTHVEINELISISGKSSNDSKLWDLPSSSVPDSMAGRFPSEYFGVCISVTSCPGWHLLELHFDILVLRKMSFCDDLVTSCNIAAPGLHGVLSSEIGTLSELPMLLSIEPCKNTPRTQAHNLPPSVRMQRRANHLFAPKSLSCLSMNVSLILTVLWLRDLISSSLHYISSTFLIFPLCPSALAPSLSSLICFPLHPSSLSHFPLCLSVVPSSKSHVPKEKRINK